LALNHGNQITALNGPATNKPNGFLTQGTVKKTAVGINKLGIIIVQKTLDLGAYKLPLKF
jgi:hypothetical protein